MLQFETVKEPRERGVLHVVRDLLVGAWMAMCALLLWPVTLLGVFFWALNEISTTRKWRLR